MKEQSLKDKLIEDIEEVLASYYEAATDGRICDDEVANFMGNKDWADTILYRIMAHLSPKAPSPYTWDPVEGKAVKVKCNCVNHPYNCAIHRPLDGSNGNKQ